MPPSDELKRQFKDQLLKAVLHLENSYKKALRLPIILSQNSDDHLETWESFSSRFARVVDLYATKLLRLEVLENDPAFDGSFKDLLNLAEKSKLIPSANLWLKLRSLRNIQAHDYTDHTFSQFAQDLLQHAPYLLELKTKCV